MFKWIEKGCLIDVNSLIRLKKEINQLEEDIIKNKDVINKYNFKRVEFQIKELKNDWKRLFKVKDNIEIALFYVNNIKLNIEVLESYKKLKCDLK